MRPLLLSFLTVVVFITKSESTHCDKELNYHDNYGYGIDVLCDGITNENVNILKDISVSNEILLDIEKSDLSINAPDIFSKLDEIRILTISQSNITFYEKFDVALEKFAQLQQLIISDSVINFVNSSKARKQIKLPSSLKELNLTNTVSLVISPYIISNLIDLESLTVSYGNLNDLSQIPICDLKLLRFLCLSRNLLTKNSFRCDLLGQAKLNLIEIDLSYNEIEKLNRFTHLHTLKKLNVEGNHIRGIDNELFVDIPNLEKIILNDNLLEELGDVFTNLNNIKTIGLRTNKLNVIRIENNSFLEELDLGNNKLVLSSISKLVNLPKLKTLTLNRNNLRGVLFQTFLSFKFLENLDLSHNEVVLDESSFWGLENLINLNVSGNNLREIPPNTFRNLNRLRKLDLSLNNLNEIGRSSAFRNLVNLEILNLSCNSIGELDYETLKTLNNLQVLDISRNRLKHFQYDLVSLLPSLTVINIKFNLLPCNVLARIIIFLKHGHINFTINEELDYSRENVAGIYCTSTTPKIERQNIRYDFLIAFVVIGLLVTTLVVLYKLFLRSKRHRYIADSIELLES